MAKEFEFTRHGRSPRTVAILIVIYGLLLSAVCLIDAAWWIMFGLALLTLPALWDLYRNPSAGVRLNDDRLNWHSGRRIGELELIEIDHMRFDTRWDFSVRVSAVLNAKKRVHLPFETVPPHREFEAALQARGIEVKRNHFAFF